MSLRVAPPGTTLNDAQDMTLTTRPYSNGALAVLLSGSSGRFILSENVGDGEINPPLSTGEFLFKVRTPFALRN